MTTAVRFWPNRHITPSVNSHQQPAACQETSPTARRSASQEKLWNQVLQVQSPALNSPPEQLLVNDLPGPASWSVCVCVWMSLSHVWLCDMEYSPWNSPGQNTGVDSLSLLQGIFPTQGSNSDLPHGRWILYQLSYKGSSGILEWVVYPFSNGSFQPKDPMGISCIAGRFFTNWAIKEGLTVLVDTAKHKLSSVSLNFLKKFSR